MKLLQFKQNRINYTLNLVLMSQYSWLIYLFSNLSIISKFKTLEECIVYWPQIISTNIKICIKSKSIYIYIWFLHNYWFIRIRLWKTLIIIRIYRFTGYQFKNLTYIAILKSRDWYFEDENALQITIIEVATPHHSALNRHKPGSIFPQALCRRKTNFAYLYTS